MKFYCIAGLAVASEVELPGTIPLDSAEMPDVTVRAGPVPKALPGARSTGATWQIAGDQFLLHIPELARFLLSAGREIRYEPAPGVADAELAIFLVGTVFGILLHQRGQIVMHASAVRVHDQAVLFCGASGAGKSTLAAALAQRGFPVVADDVCAIDVNGAAPVVQSDGRQLKLWEQAIEQLGLAEQRLAPVRNRLRKFYVEPAASHATPLPLGAVYALREARPPHKAGIEPPNVVDAALLLRRNAYRPLLVRRMDQHATYFRAASAIANNAGIFHLTRNLTFRAMPDVLAMLERHWADLGMMEAAA